MQIPCVTNGAAVLPGECAEYLRTLRIPAVQEGDYNGRHIVVTPWSLDLARYLANLGKEFPSPIEIGAYNWPGRFKPMSHQIRTAGMLTLYERAFVLNDPGTGKTASVIWAWDYLRRVGKAGSLLVACPLSCIRSVWQDELFALVPTAKVAILHGTRKERVDMLKEGADVYVINHDGLTVLPDELRKNRSITHIAVDEASMFKNGRTDRFRALAKIAVGRGLWLMTGSPAAQSPQDAYALCTLVSPQRVPRSFTLFRDAVCLRDGMYDWQPRPEAKQIVFNAMQPAVRFSRSQCLDLPPCTYQFRDPPLSAMQQKMAKKIVEDWLIEDAATGVAVTAPNAAVRLTKLLQVYQGAVRGEDGMIVDVDCGPRIDALREIIDSMPEDEKVVVFASYTAVVRKLARELEKCYTIEIIDGSVPESERRRIVHEFQNAKHPRILLAHPRTTSHGLTLTAATAVVWYGPVHSAETYEQGNRRVDRQGQVRPTTVYHLQSALVERQAFRNVRALVGEQASLLNLYEIATQGAIT